MISSPIAFFALSLVILQVTASLNPDARGEIYTLQSRDDGLTKRARKADYQAHPAGELVCRPFGLCEPCPVDEVSDCSFPHFVHPVTSHEVHSKTITWRIFLRSRMGNLRTIPKERFNVSEIFACPQAGTVIKSRTDRTANTTILPTIRE